MDFTLPKCRVFLALPFSDQYKKGLVRIQKTLTRKFSEVHWTPEPNFHLTLRFFGELSGPQIKLVLEKVAPIAAQCEPFEFSVSRLNFFGTPHRPRVLFMEPVELSAGFIKLAELLDEVFPDPQGRKLTPHVTLARFKKLEQVKVSSAQQYVRMLGEIEQGYQNGELPDWAEFAPLSETIEELVLYETVWGKKTVHYVPFYRWKLGEEGVGQEVGTEVAIGA